MPLPTGNVSWPPHHLHHALEHMETWDTWWSGDPDRLEVLYGGGGGMGRDPRHFQFAGGMMGRLARWWWGTPTAPGERRTKLHVPIAGDICGGSANLLFSEPPKVTADDDATQERLDDLLDDGMLATLQTAAEVGAALGGIYLRPVYDIDMADRPWIDAVHADRAVPTFRWGRLAEVTFWQVVHQDDKDMVWRHLECHEPGLIRHGLYQGTKDKLGMAVPLENHPATAGFAKHVDDTGAIPTGYDGLDVSYIPNDTSRRWRCKPELANLGRSDLDGVEPLMDALDETYASWMRDIRLGKGRIVVPNAYLQNNGPGKGASWNPDQEAFAGINALAKGDNISLEVAQFAIRVAEHQSTAEDLINQILRSAGYSGQTFGLGGDTAMTATEVVSKERRSMTTRGRKILRWRPGLSNVLEALLAVDREVFGAKVTPQRPVIEFSDGVQEDPLSLANTVNVLGQAQAASTDVKVRMVHPEWDDSMVAEEVKQIHQEQGMGVPDPFQAGEMP